MERMRIADVEEDIDHELVSKEQIDAKIHEMAALASEDYRDKNPLLVAVLKGAVNTLVAFTQAMSIPVQIDFMSLSSYGSGTVSSGEVTVRQDLSADVRGRHILIVEDIVDSGRTLAWLVAELKRRGYRLAVASAKPTFYVTQIMDHFNLSRYFEVIAGTDLNGPKVTKSQVIEEALERMSLSDHRDQVIMVGDREHDILGARRCGIQCVAVSYGYGSREELEKAQPLQIVASADELLNFFV